MKRLSSWVGGSHLRWLLSKVSSDAVPTEPGPHTPQIKSFSDLISSRIFPISLDRTRTSPYHTTLDNFLLWNAWQLALVARESQNFFWDPRSNYPTQFSLTFGQIIDILGRPDAAQTGTSRTASTSHNLQN